MSNHTHGTCKTCDDGEVVCAVGRDGRHTAVAEIRSGCIEYQSNARLIAAAPELLAALVRLANQFDDCHYSGRVPESVADSDALQAARRVINRVAA